MHVHARACRLLYGVCYVRGGMRTHEGCIAGAVLAGAAVSQGQRLRLRRGLSADHASVRLPAERHTLWRA